MITYRSALEADLPFLYYLHRSAMRVYVEETFGPWDEAWQENYYREHFPLPALRIIQWQGEDVGMVYLQERAEEFFLAAIEILPVFQGRGIGTKVVRDLMDRASNLGKPVALQVLKSNLRARDLYQRLGFGVTGENRTHYILAYEPHSP